MSEADEKPDDTGVEQTMGNLLRAGVILAALVTAVGGAVFLAKRWDEPVPDRHVFHGQPPELCGVAGVVGLH